MPCRREIYLDLLDTILLEMSASHPSLPAGEEAQLKHLLMGVMADEQGWQADPDGMINMFDTAANVLRTLRERRMH